MTELPDSTTEQNSITESNTPAGARNTEHMIPKSRFDEINDKYKALAEKLATLEGERQQREAQTLAEQNRFKELYEQTKAQLDALQQVQQTAERFKGSLQATNESRIAQIPEEKRHLVPEFDDPVSLSAWLDRAMPDLVTMTGKPKAPSLDGGSGSPAGSSAPALSSTHDALADVAAQYGYKVDKERVAKYAKQPISMKEQESK